jgi:cell division initiation protein
MDFKKAIRGYDPEQVDEYVRMLREGYENLTGEYGALEAENHRLETENQRLEAENRQSEAENRRLNEQLKEQPDASAIARALVTAEQVAKQIKDRAQAQAEELLRQAKSEAARMLAEAERETGRLTTVRDSVALQLRELMRSLDRPDNAGPAI